MGNQIDDLTELLTMGVALQLRDALAADIAEHQYDATVLSLRCCNRNRTRVERDCRPLDLEGNVFSFLEGGLGDVALKWQVGGERHCHGCG
jgi:hypothetical protein